MISATISNVSVSVGNASFTIEDPLEARAILTFTVLDSSGTASYQRGQPVTFSDPGIISYTGFVQSDTPMKEGIILPYVEHVIVCMDGEYNLDKRSNSTNYLNWVAGNIAVDFVRRDLANEGITIAAAMHRDTTASDFNAGNLSGTVGATNANVSINNGLTQTLSTTDDGDLELATAGSALSLTETTTSDFSTGTLTGVYASSNQLNVSTVSAICAQAQLPVTASGATASLEIWSGSMLVASNDTLNYDIRISSSSPAFTMSVDLGFSDATFLSGVASGVYDQNRLPSAADLSGHAQDNWYTRNITVAGQAGKTINTVLINFVGSPAGTYTVYIKNCYLGSQPGSKFFSTTATTTQVNPPVVTQATVFFSSFVSGQVVQVWDPAAAERISPAHSIDAVKLVGSSLVTWNSIQPTTGAALPFPLPGVLTPAGVLLFASYDGTTWLSCANGQALPGLPAGANVAGTSLYLQERFVMGSDPTALPALNLVTVTLASAPNATTTDITAAYGTTSQWNTGTLTLTAPNANGDLALIGISRDWNDNLITNQTFFATSSFTQAAASGIYTVTIHGNGLGQSRLDFAGVTTDFTCECDVLWNASLTPLAAIVYRQTNWGTGFDAYAYTVGIQSAAVELVSGSNIGGSSNGTPTLIKSFSTTVTQNVFHHLKIVVAGTRHQVYFDYSATPVIDATDTKYTAAGNIGLMVQTNGTSGDCSFDNFTFSPTLVGTWQSPSISLSSLGTAGNSRLDYGSLQANGQALAPITAQTSIDGGATWQTVPDGSPIGNLPVGTNVSGKSLLIQLLLSGATLNVAPVILGLFVRVCGSYPGASGTRDTAPMGNDMQITRTVGSGWGNAFDGQAWSQNGTGTTAVGTGEATITNTTGTVYMRLGTLTGTNIQGTHRFSLSSSSETAGIFLRYVDANNYYALAATTSTTSILKRLAGVTTTLASVSMALSINTPYRMHFLTANASPVSLFGNVWPDGSLEPTVNSLGQWNDSLWTLTASD